MDCNTCSVKAIWLRRCVLCRSGSLAYNRNTAYCDLLCVGDAHEEEDTDKIDFTQIGLFVVQLSHG